MKIYFGKFGGKIIFWIIKLYFFKFPFGKIIIETVFWKKFSLENNFWKFWRENFYLFIDSKAALEESGEGPSPHFVETNFRHFLCTGEWHSTNKINFSRQKYIRICRNFFWVDNDQKKKWLSRWSKNFWRETTYFHIRILYSHQYQIYSHGNIHTIY